MSGLSMITCKEMQMSVAVQCFVLPTVLFRLWNVGINQWLCSWVISMIGRKLVGSCLQKRWKDKNMQKHFNFVIQITHKDFRILALVIIKEHRQKKNNGKKYSVHFFSLQWLVRENQRTLKQIVNRQKNLKENKKSPKNHHSPSATKLLATRCKSHVVGKSKRKKEST